ncbi:MAG: carboxypeptidase-like regulatory domain-containing protein, partial [Longimicrobiales bacterium]
MTSLRAMLGVALLVAALGVPVSALAQSQATTGIIRGTITDPTGQPVASARVNLVQAETGFTRSVTTNQSGIFTATLLPVGTYTVTVESLQFVQSITRAGVRLRLGSTANLDLSFAAVQLEGINVTLTQPLVDVRDVTSSSRLSSEALAGLPNNGRDFLDLTLLTPGVGIVQGPDGDELTINGQRGIF